MSAEYSHTTRWRTRLAESGRDQRDRREAKHSVNSAFVPRNHLVEEVIVAAVESEDLVPLERLLTVLAKPFDDQPEFQRYT